MSNIELKGNLASLESWFLCMILTWLDSEKQKPLKKYDLSAFVEYIIFLFNTFKLKTESLTMTQCSNLFIENLSIHTSLHTAYLALLLQNYKQKKKNNKVT